MLNRKYVFFMHSTHGSGAGKTCLSQSILPEDSQRKRLEGSPLTSAFHPRKHPK